MTTPTWLPTGTITWGPGPARQVRPRQREERDINPRSATFNTTRLVADGASASCTNDCPAYGTILDSGCTVDINQDGEYARYYNAITDGNCGTTVDYVGMGRAPCQ